MADSTAARLAQVQEVMSAVGSDPGVQQAAIAAVIPPPPASEVTQLWMTLIRGLLLLLVVALGGLLYLLIDDKGTDVVITVFTSLLTGLLGLFAPSPTSSGN
jgi:hypothetical protein